MDALNDAVAHPELVPLFEGEGGWETSLFRDNSDWRSYLNDARALFEGNFSALADIEEAFSYTPTGADGAIYFDFSSPEPSFYFGPSLGYVSTLNWPYLWSDPREFPRLHFPHSAYAGRDIE